jgi:hypothetical protein
MACLLAMTLLVSFRVLASGTDLHRLWDDRCAICHGHAGEFAREYLSLSAGSLQGRHHVDDLRRFLNSHYLAGREVDAVYDMLFAQVQTQARFRNECSGCHATAARFVREALLLDDGLLYSRTSGRPVRGFLEHHRNLEPDDIVFYTRLLTRVAGEVYRP